MLKSFRYNDLNQLKIIHTFEYYDFPLFFISKSPSNELFLNYYVEEVEENLDKWLFSRITNKELKNLYELRLSVLDLLNKLYTKKRLYHLYTDFSLKQPNEDLNIELVDANNFDEESFPEEDFFVEYDYVTKQKLVKVEHELIDSSRFKLVLKDEHNSHDISLDLLLDIMTDLKESINDIAFDIGNKLMGQQSTHEINLRVDSFQPSSFGVWLKTEPLEADLFEVPEKSLNNLFELIDDIQSKDLKEIEEQIDIDEEFSIKTIKSVKNLLKDIVDNNFSLTLKANTKSHMMPREVKFDKTSYSKLDVLNKILKDKSEKLIEEIEIEGILTSINTTYNKFRISTTSIGDISGKMSTQMYSDLKKNKNLQFRVPSIIKATLRKEIVSDYLEDDYYEKYTLVQYEQP